MSSESPNKREERRQQTPLCKKGKKRKCYSRVYRPNGEKHFNSQQINELKRMNDYYGYESNFSEKFNFSLCTGCNSKFYRLENGLESADQNITTILLDNTLEFTNNLTRENSLTSPNSFFENNDDINPELLTSEVEEIEEIEINFKLVIKAADGKCNVAKWETILANDCQKFRSKLDQLIQEQFEDQVVFREDYSIAYKQEKETGPGIQLTNKKDWEIFLKENERIISNKKVLLILVKMKRDPKKTRLRDSNDQAEFVEKTNKRNKSVPSSTNQIPKKKNIDNADAIIAQNIMELHSKWYCKEHDRSCYVDLTRHIPLTTNHLSTWARSIQHNIATLDDPPTLPLFDATNNSTKKSNNNTQNTQASNPFHLPAGFFPMFFHPAMFNQYNNDYNLPTNSLPQTNNSISLPTIHEFFENLEKTYGECNFEEVKNKFLQEEIDVLDILSLKDYDWQNLGIKLGVKTKIMREFKKYKK
ncbi:unnamed protein product [Rhizophagus irregularis]|nr:unnamed protein product [Rhizophagus irregularis]